jgi:hypothetical protein
MRRTMYRAIILGIAGFMMTGFIANPARSNGDNFFEAQEIEGDPRYVVFGGVKDTEGRPLQDVLVIIESTDPERSYEQTYTDVLGRFRTLDIGRAIESLGYSIDPSGITVEAWLEGYHTVRRLNRSPASRSVGVIEISFVMAKDSDLTSKP